MCYSHGNPNRGFNYLNIYLNMKNRFGVCNIGMESMSQFGLFYFQCIEMKLVANFAFLPSKHSNILGVRHLHFQCLPDTECRVGLRQTSLCFPFFSTFMERRITVCFLSVPQRKKWTCVSHFSLRTFFLSLAVSSYMCLSRSKRQVVYVVCCPAVMKASL